MAKGRKQTTSRSERLLGVYSYGHVPTAADSADLGEDEVWSTVGSMENGGDEQLMSDSQGEWIPRASDESVSIKSRRRLPREERHVGGGLSLAFKEQGKTASPRIIHQFHGQESMASPRGRHMATSAPVNVPDWSKIYRVDSVESLHDQDEYEDDRESEMVPPHEYLAREYGRMAANSVFEGVGRTLKGRDLSRVRDAVWSQTGFDG